MSQRTNKAARSFSKGLSASLCFAQGHLSDLFVLLLHIRVGLHNEIRVISVLAGQQISFKQLRERAAW